MVWSLPEHPETNMPSAGTRTGPPASQVSTLAKSYSNNLCCCNFRNLYSNKIKDLVKFPHAVWESKEGAAVSFRVDKMSIGKGTWLRPLQQGGGRGRYLALIQYSRLQQALQVQHNRNLHWLPIIYTTVHGARTLSLNDCYNAKIVHWKVNFFPNLRTWQY